MRADYFRERNGAAPKPTPNHQRNFLCSGCQRLTGHAHLIRALHEPDAPRYCEACWAQLSEAFLPLHEQSTRLNSYYKRTYGIDFEEYGRLYLRQRGRCAICEIHPIKPLVVDHDHATGVVRGLLCSKCNSGLGMFLDDIGALGRAITYLAKSGRLAMDVPAKESPGSETARSDESTAV